MWGATRFAAACTVTPLDCARRQSHCHGPSPWVRQVTLGGLSDRQLGTIKANVGPWIAGLLLLPIALFDEQRKKAFKARDTIRDVLVEVMGAPPQTHLVSSVVAAGVHGNSKHNSRRGVLCFAPSSCVQQYPVASIQAPSELPPLPTLRPPQRTSALAAWTRRTARRSSRASWRRRTTTGAASRTRRVYACSAICRRIRITCIMCICVIERGGRLLQRLLP